MDEFGKFTYLFLTKQIKKIFFSFLGSSIRHNDDPTVACAPFLYLPTNVMYSIMWLKKNLNYRGKKSWPLGIY